MIPIPTVVGAQLLAEILTVLTAFPVYILAYVTILNRKALEQNSCECYAINKFDFNRLLEARPIKRAVLHRGQRIV